MKRSEDAFPVTSGSVTIWISVYRKDRRFFFRRKGADGWQTVVRKDRKDIVEEARATAKLIAAQKAAVLGLKAAEVHEFLEWRREQLRSTPLSSELAKYISAKEAANISKLHLRSIKALAKILHPLSKANIRRITPEDIEGVLPITYTTGKGENERAHAISARRRNNILDEITAFFRWCRKRGTLPEGATAPERIDRRQESAPKKDFFSIKEFQAIAIQVSDAWLPWFGIACFAGLRTEEIQNLQWSDINLTRAMINVRAEISKTRSRRLVPIQPNLLSLLIQYSGRTGKVCPSRADNYIRSIKGWKKNGPRHSYGSYRLAVLQNAPQLAEEMGNSIPMIRKHYAEAVLPEEGTAWFSQNLSRPEGVLEITGTSGK